MSVQVALANKDRQSMLFLGEPLNFSYDEPGPIEVELGELTEAQKNQLFYNWRQGVLSVSDESQLEEVCNTAPAATKSFVTPKELPMARSPKDAVQQIDDSKKVLRKLLSKRIGTIKKEVSQMTISQVRDIIELENEWKKRKGLLKFLDELIGKHEKDVTQRVGVEEVGDSTFPVGVKRDKLDQIMDVIESDEKTVTFIPSDEVLD
jgi:hypothetical protein